MRFETGVGWIFYIQLLVIYNGKYNSKSLIKLYCYMIKKVSVFNIKFKIL